MVKILSTTGAIALALLMSGPALKGRFLVPDMFAYVLPTLIFAFCTVFLTALNPIGLPKRASAALFMLLPLCAATVGFLVGYTGESRLLIIIAVNCTLGILVVAFPWTVRSFNVLAGTLVAVGLLLSIYALFTFNSSVVGDDAVETINEARLVVSFSVGLGALACLYFVVKSFSLIWLGALALLWVGLALNLSRGPVLFCGIASILYLVYAFGSNTVQFGRGKKLILVFAILAMVPTFMSQLMSIEKNQVRFTRMLDVQQELLDGGRGAIWAESFRSFSEAPIFGNGLGASVSDGATPHNLFLQYAEDNGLVGLGLMLLLYSVVGVCIWRALRLANSQSINMVLAAGSMFVYMLLNFSKSSNAYINRESFTLTALPLAVFASIAIGENVRGIVVSKNRKRRRRRRVATAIAISELANSEKPGQELSGEATVR